MHVCEVSCLRVFTVIVNDLPYQLLKEVQCKSPAPITYMTVEHTSLQYTHLQCSYVLLDLSQANCMKQIKHTVVNIPYLNVIRQY